MKKILSIFTLLALLLSLASCSHIEDTNGPDDYSLVSLTDEDILAKERVIKRLSKRSSNGDTTTYEVKRISGVEDILVFSADRNELLTLDVTVTATEGNLKVALIHSDEIIETIPINGGEHTVKIENFEGRFYLRLAAESAACMIEATLSSSKSK